MCIYHACIIVVYTYRHMEKHNMNIKWLDVDTNFHISVYNDN